MVTDIDYTYFGEHSTVSRIAETLYCIPETNVTFHVNYTSLKKKLHSLFKKLLLNLHHCNFWSLIVMIAQHSVECGTESAQLLLFIYFESAQL